MNKGNDVMTDEAVANYLKDKCSVDLYDRWAKADTYTKCLALHELMLFCAIGIRAEGGSLLLAGEFLSLAAVLLHKGGSYLAIREEAEEKVGVFVYEA